MNKKLIVLALFAGSFLLHACQKDIDVFVPDAGQFSGPDTSWQTSISINTPVSVLKNNLLATTYQDTIMVNPGVSNVVTPFGIEINFPPNCCVNGLGQLVSGKVDVEVQLLKKKGDLIRMDKPSMQSDTVLMTAGEIFISLKKDGQALQLAPGAIITINYFDAPTIPQMRFFMGDESNPQVFKWSPAGNPSRDTVVILPQNYQVFSGLLRWISIAQPFELNAGVKVNVTADMASYFTNANTIAFTVFKDVRSVVAMRPDAVTRKFITAKLPVGKAITVVVISKLGDDYYLGSASAVTQTASSNPSLQNVPVVPVKKSLAQILSYLDSL